MSLVSLAFLKEDLEKVSRLLMEVGVVEIEEAQRFIVEKEGLSKVDVRSLIEEANLLLQRINLLCEKLNIRIKRQKVGTELRLGPQVLEQIRGDFSTLEDRVDKLLLTIEENEAEIERIEYKSRLLSYLEDMGVRVEELLDLPHLEFKMGILSLANLRGFLEVLDGMSVLYKVSGYYKGNAFIFLLYLKEFAKRLNSAMRSFGFKELGEVISGKPLSEVLEDLELEVWGKREEIALAKKELSQLKDTYVERLANWCWLLENNLKIYRAMDKFLESKFGYFLSFWIPSAELSSLKVKLKGTLNGRFEVREEKAEYLIKERKVSYEEIPSYLRHPLLLRPFRRLLTLYGWPAYLHIDPTLFMALSFVLMFGIMFADLGHGLILAFLGLLPSLQRRLRALQEFGAIALYCGISAGIFGILFGSFFGKEDIIEALWFKPGEQPLKFLGLGIGVGVLLISLGIILNIIQYIWQRKMREVLFSQWGLFSLIFYWLGLFLVVSVVRYGSINLSPPLVFFILLIPLALLTLGDALFSKDKGEKDFAESVAKSMEVIVGLLTNTISYIRVAAFGLTHLALMGSVYLVADTLGNIKGMRESIIIEGNIGVILLEGLIVFIQCLRLEYYEFFSKFFLLRGRQFKPLSLEEKT